MLVNSEKAMLRAATVLAGFGSSPASTVMEPQHHDSAHCKARPGALEFETQGSGSDKDEGRQGKRAWVKRSMQR